MDTSNTVMAALLVIIVIVLIVYIIYSVKSEGSVIKTLWKKDPGKIGADQVYYLPAALLVIKATAKVIITKDAVTTNIIDTKLSELSLDTTVQLVPDTRHLLAIKYIPSWFSNDELQLNIGPSGLIEGINLTAEDRISNIVSQLTEAPKMILSSDQALASRTIQVAESIAGDGTPIVIETKEYTNNFLILSKEIREKTASRVWKINIDGTANISTTVDASFALTFDVPSGDAFKFDDQANEFDGILMRPLQTLTMNIFKGAVSAVPDVQYQLVVPDESSVVTIGIKRSPFVKKVYGFKMANGILAENTINKPSEAEGLISIPIKIAKAIISIPAQIISFKYDNTKRQTALETEQQNLAKAQLQTRKDEITKESDLLKVQLDSQKTILSFEGEITKTKLDAEKTLIIAQKDVITANKDLTVAKKDWENAKKDLEDLLKKIEDAKKA